MKSRKLGITLLLIGSIAVGMLAGQINWVLFQKTIPPTMVSELNLITVRGAAWTVGLFTGAALFVWGLLVAWLTPIFRGKGRQEPPA